MKMYHRKAIFFMAVLLVLALIPQSGLCQKNARELIRIPDVLGYTAVKCDFHTHTVFSDGNVWPTVRCKEAWMNGLDAFSLTDHIEYTPHKEDVKVDHNRSFELAKSTADAYHLTLIRGVEITRPMPPGHINAIFITDGNAIDTKEWRDAVRVAFDQGAFIFWNHPGWRGQQADGIAKWYEEHTELLDKGWVKGIEIVNGDEYYPEAHQWCLDKKLTMLGNSDIHDPITMSYDPAENEHRPINIVYAKDNSPEAIKDALLDRRTVVYYKDWLIGEEKFLHPIFNESVELDTTSLTLKGKSRKAIQISNHSSVDFHLELDGSAGELSVPQSITLYAGKAVMLSVQSQTETLDETKTIELPYRITNLKVRPNEGLPVRLSITVKFEPKDS